MWIFTLFGLHLGMDIDIPGMNCPMPLFVCVRCFRLACGLLLEVPCYQFLCRNDENQVVCGGGYVGFMIYNFFIKNIQSLSVVENT